MERKRRFAKKTSPAAQSGQRPSFHLPGLVACAAAVGLILHGGALANQAYLRFTEEAAPATIPFGNAPLEPAMGPLITTGWSAATLPASIPAPGVAPVKRAAALALLDTDFQADPDLPDSQNLAYGLRGTVTPAAAAKVERDLRCLALNIYHEARGESAAGRRAVAHVVMNRVADRRFPNSVCEVVYQGGQQKRYRCQFSWWCDGRSDRPMNGATFKTTTALAREVYWGLAPDPTEGALWYHADYVTPYWRSHFAEGPTIGRHIFYGDRKTKSAPPANQLASR